MKRFKLEIIVTAASLLLMGGVVYMLDMDRPTSAMVDAVKMSLAQAEAQLAAARALPDLPNLPRAWEQTHYELSSCGLEITIQVPEDIAAAPTQGSTSWKAGVRGEASDVFTCLTAVSKRLPVVLEGFRLERRNKPSDPAIAAAVFRVHGYIEPAAITGSPT